MSENTPEPEQSTESAENTANDAPDAESNADETVDYWKQKAREHERRAKENSKAKKRLDEIEEANKTEAQKAADKLAAETARAEAAEARVVAFQIATEFSLDADDASLVANQPDEESMRGLAKRLAADKRNSSPKPDLTQGGKGGQNHKSKGDQFADFAGNFFTR